LNRILSTRKPCAMHLLERAAAVLLCVAWLTGCANWAVDMAPDRPDQPWNPAVTATGEIVPGGKSPIESPSGYVLPANAELAKLPQPLAVDRQRAYSLPELIDIAQMNNPLTRTAWNEARKVALAAGIAESAYLPRITAAAVGAYLTSEGGSSASTSARGANVNINNNINSTALGTISVASLQWLLFDFGERAAIVDAARQASVASNVAFTAAHQQVIYDVSVAFYVHAAARARAATAAQSLKNAQAVEVAARDRSKNSIGTVVEVSQAAQATAQAKLAVVQSTGAAQDAYLTLISAMGISPLTRIRVADVSRRRLSPAMRGPVENVIAIALARRPDVLSAYALQKASLAKVRAAEAEFLPKVFLSGNRVYSSGNLNVTAIPSIGDQAATVNLSGGSRTSSTVLLGATVPLYDAGVRAAMLGQAQADADNAETMLTRRRNEAVRQIVLSDNALRTSLSAYSASQALSSAAQTTFDAALAAYRNGIGSITDVTIAQTQLLQARNSSSDAYSTSLSAAASLALSTGALGSAPPMKR
jgi:outer membrane protein